MHSKTLYVRIIGFLASLLLTSLSYYIIMHPESLQFPNEQALRAIFILAPIQAAIQAICFLDIWHEKAPFWNLIFFASTLSIIAIIVFFSMWIMNTLNYNMMPTMGSAISRL